MTISEEIRQLLKVLLDGMDAISKWHYHDEVNPFLKLQSSIREDFNNIPKFKFKSKKDNKLFRIEIETMTDFMGSQVHEIVKLKPRRPENQINEIIKKFRINEDPYNNQIQYNIFSATQEPHEDSIIKKFLKNSLTIIGSLKSFLGKEFEAFLEVLEELFEFILDRLF